MFPNPRFSTRLLCKSWILDLGIGQDVPKSTIFHKTSVQILDLGVGQDVPKSKIFHKTPVQILDLGSWFWAGMHSLAFSGSDKIALSTF